MVGVIFSQHSLVEVVEQPDTPRPPSAGKGFGEIHRRCDRRDLCSEAENDPSDDKHGDVLRSALEDDPDKHDQGAPEDGRTAAETISSYACEDGTEEACRTCGSQHGGMEAAKGKIKWCRDSRVFTSDEDGCCVEAGRRSVEIEVVGIRRQDIEPVQH